MTVLNLPLRERDALKALDVARLDSAIEQCFLERQASALLPFALDSCGIFIATEARKYEKALAAYGNARASRKAEETAYEARRASRDLAYAVREMIQRAETEEKEGQLFYVEDLIRPPYVFSDSMTVHVSYRWRAVPEDRWNSGNIDFVHVVASRSEYLNPAQARKLSAVKLAQKRQDELYREWDHLLSLALHSVRDFFRSGGNGAEIPQRFHVKPDSRSGSLNNFSADFWRARP